MYNRNALDNTIFKIGIYIRLSREDGDDMESESVTNQRSLLTSYLKAQELVAVDIYVDDGYTVESKNTGNKINVINYIRYTDDDLLTIVNYRLQKAGE